MSRFLIALILIALLLFLPARAVGRDAAQPAFFSMIFPLLLPEEGEEAEKTDDIWSFFGGLFVI